MEVLSLSMVKVSKESVDNKGTIANHTAAVSFFGLSDFFFFQCYCIPYIVHCRNLVYLTAARQFNVETPDFCVLTAGGGGQAACKTPGLQSVAHPCYDERSHTCRNFVTKFLHVWSEARSGHQAVVPTATSTAAIAYQVY